MEPWRRAVRDGTDFVGVAGSEIASSGGRQRSAMASRRLMLHRQSDGLWPAASEGAGVNFWTTALAVNTLMILAPTQRHSLLRLTPWFNAARWRLRGSSG